jgi:Na+-translocating ferredoxin:NAD+ oxidoreductase RnfG subunit
MGSVILGADRVQSSDKSEVEALAYVTGVTIENTVYFGHNGGSSCGNSTKKQAEGFAGTKVTYCFKIQNTGKTYLGDITIDNVDLEYYNDGTLIGPLAPGNFTFIAVPKLIYDSLKNVVRVKANPVSIDGKRLEGAAPVTDDDDSSVSKKPHSPSIEIDNKVYIGTDGGHSCDKATDKVTGYQGDYVTYCFIVKNTGNTHLNSITVHNHHLSFTDISVGILAPGESKLVIYPTVITGNDINVVQVAANPVTPSGEEIIGAEDVSDSDPSEVETIDANPRISIKNKVYLGGDDGSKCGTDVAVEKTEGYFGDAVVYCLTVQNTGDTHLSKVVINDIGLDFFDDKTIGTLAPGQSVTVVVKSIIEESLENTADVTAIPVTPAGVEITGVDDVTDNDSSSVEKLEHDASILIENNVYVGHDSGKSCGTSNATSRAAGFNGTDVTYCFKVTNTGETHLGAVTIEDRLLSFYDSSIGSLAPGASATVYFQNEIIKDLRNVAVVTAVRTMQCLSTVCVLT